MASYTNKHCLDIGVLILVSSDHFPLARYLSRKLECRLVAPFPIRSIIYPVAFYILLPVEYGRVHPVFHACYIGVPRVGPVPLSPPTALPLDDVAAGEYEVEAILYSRLGHLGTKYLIKWVGYPVFESMWEPIAYLANAPDILNWFLSHRGR